jgi:tRNA uridine 5-carbamoylmethylation protein Kti12
MAVDLADSSGASCSGKTLVAKHLVSLLPGNAIIVHQDDFAPVSGKCTSCGVLIDPSLSADRSSALLLSVP